MNKFSKVSLVISLSLIAGTGYTQNSIQQKNINVVNTSNRSVTQEIEQQNVVVINGLNIQLSAEDKVKAKNFHLTENEFAQYKYLMEYTPRGYWTPDIDPVMALGSEATTDQERTRYAEIVYKMKTEREEKEYAFASAALEVEKKATPDDPRWVNPLDSKFGFAEQLPGNKNTLTSVFLVANECVASNLCIKAMTDIVKSNSTYNKLDFYFISSTKNSISSFAMSVGISSDKLKEGSISLNHENGEIASNKLNEYQLPFVITQDNHGANVDEIDI